MVLDAELHAPTSRIDVELRLLGSEPKPVTQWMPVRLFHASADTAARLVLLEDAPIAPGQAGLVQLVLDQPIAAAAGDRFVLRDTTSQRTIGGGTFLDLRAPARKRRAPERLAQLRAHRIGNPEAALTTMFEIAPRFVELSAFARDRALSATQVQEIIGRLSIVASQTAGGTFAMSAPVWLELKRTLLRNCRPSMRTTPICLASASNGCGCSLSRGCRRRRCFRRFKAWFAAKTSLWTARGCVSPAMKYA